MIKMFFGSPGSGKTTLACRVLYRSRLLKEYDHYYANFETSLAEFVNLDKLGETWTFPPHSLIVIDEAGIEYNSRKYKTLSQSLIQWLKLHRHYKCDVIIISQSWEDVDITFRRLTTDLYHIRKLGPFTRVRRINKIVGIDKESHQIIDQYQFAGIFGNLLGRDNFCIFLRNGYYKYFDSYSTPPTPIMENRKMTPLRRNIVLQIRNFPMVLNDWLKRKHLKLPALVVAWLFIVLLLFA